MGVYIYIKQTDYFSQRTEFSLSGYVRLVFQFLFSSIPFFQFFFLATTLASFADIQFKIKQKI